MTLLKVSGLCKSYGNLDVLSDVGFAIERGEFVSILGPSGAGKSTILQMLTGATAPDGGTFEFAGASIKPGQNPFAFMPQRDALMPWRRLIDNIALGLEVDGHSRVAAHAMVRPHLGDFGLAGFERHYPAQLSGGMRQRAALLRTVVQNREMLLLDEPLGALDALTRTRMQHWLAGMWARHRWTVLLITHDVREAVLLSDRVYVLSQRPARILHEFRVDFPHPRPPTGSPQLSALEAEILQSLLSLEA